MSYAQRNKVYSQFTEYFKIFCLPQYGNTEWLVDIQNTSTLTGEKLKIKFSFLKLTRPPDEFVIFDTRPKDFIVVSDDLTTANMDPCTHKQTALIHFGHLAKSRYKSTPI